MGRYERDEIIPSIEVAANMAKLVDTTVAYLLGEATDNALLKDQAMLKRLHDINSLSEQEKIISSMFWTDCSVMLKPARHTLRK